MAKRSRQRPAAVSEQAASALKRIYEGPEVLAGLLTRAGSKFGIDEVAACFLRAQEAGEERGDVIPALFDSEPHFASPEEARRLYGNLFALWDRVAAGGTLEDDVPAVVVRPQPVASLPSLPARGEVRGNKLTPDVVEAVWKHVDSLSERERRRLRDRFEGAQPNLMAWLDSIPLAEAAVLAVSDLSLEIWAMFDVAFGDRLKAVEYRALRALESEPLALEATQPALGTYVAEALDLLKGELPDFSDEIRAQVERVMATMTGAFAEVLAEDAEG